MGNFPAAPIPFGMDRRDFAIEVGVLLRAETVVFRISEIHGGIVTLVNAKNFEARKVKKAQLETDIAKGIISPATEVDSLRAFEDDIFVEDESPGIDHLLISDLSKSALAHFLRIQRYLTKLHERGHRISPRNGLLPLELARIQREIGDPKSPSVASIYKHHLSVTRANGDMRVVIPRYDCRGGKGGSRVSEKIELATQQVLAGKRNDSQATLKTQEVMKDIETKIIATYPNDPNLALMLSWSTVNRRIKNEFSAYERFSRNHGKKAAEKKFKFWHPRERADRPNLVWETDDTDTREFLIDDRSGLPWGRAYLTSVIDQYDGFVLGMELSEKPRSVDSAVRAIVSAILPKDMGHPHFALVISGCEFYGKPFIVVFDNALYNHANEIELFSAEVPITPAWAIPETPEEKTCIEHFHDVLKDQYISKQAGDRGPLTQREGLNKGREKAVKTLVECRQTVWKWVYDEYSNNPREIQRLKDSQSFQISGLTPRQARHQYYAQSGQNPRIPVDIGGMKILNCQHAIATVRDGLLKFEQILYHGHFLHIYEKKHGVGAKLEIRYDPQDLGSVWVKDEKTNTYIILATAWPEYAAGLSLFQHGLIRKLCREAKKQNPAKLDYLKHREDLRVLTAQLAHSKKIRERRLAVRVGGVARAPTQGAEEAAAKTRKVTEEVTELESVVSDIDEITFDMSEEGW